MSWILIYVITVSLFYGIQSQNSSTVSSIPKHTTPEPYNRTQYCKWPCTCPEALPRCPPGISLIMDGCDCCRTCAKQLGEECNEADSCDNHRGLYCDYSSDKPWYEKGVCAYLHGTGCEHNGVVYRNGQSFHPNCKYHCLCLNGAIGCMSLCDESQPPRVWCQMPQRVKIHGQCCDQWICEESRRERNAAPLKTSAAHSSGNGLEQCVPQTTSWSPCSKTCGLGVSLRLTNANRHCQMIKERRLCNIRPCDVDITQHIKPGKLCLNIYREEHFMNFTISGCTSKKLYRPKYCGVCTDRRCCIPSKSKTLQVKFQCPNGVVLTWQVMWINACFCNISCKNPNDIFEDLEQYYENQEITH